MTEKKFGIWYHDSSLIQFSYWLIKITLGTIVKLIWVKQIEGIENMPDNEPIIVAFNHQSFFDFLCFVSVCPRKIHFLSAEKFFFHPLWGPLVKLTGQIKVDRKSHDKTLVHEIVTQHLKSNKVIGIFPEGTRSPDRFDMLPAFTGVAEFALRNNVRVLPAGIRGAYDVMAKHDKLPKFKKIITIHVGQPIDLSEYNHSKMDKKTYRIVTNKIMLEIAKLSQKNYPHLNIEE